MIASGSTCVPNSRDATFATVSAREVARFARFYDDVDDWHEKAQRLARASAGGGDKAFNRTAFGDGFGLMGMKLYGLAVYPKHLCSFWRDHAIGHQLRGGLATLEMRVDRHQRISPDDRQHTGHQSQLSDRVRTPC